MGRDFAFAAYLNSPGLPAAKAGSPGPCFFCLALQQTSGLISAAHANEPRASTSSTKACKGAYKFVFPNNAIYFA